MERRTLVAVLEFASRSLLPEAYRHVDRGEIIRRVRELSQLVRD